MEKDRKEWDSLMNSGEAVPHLGDGEDERSARDLGDSLNNESPFNTDKSSLHSISVQEKPSPSILNTAELPNINSTTSVAEATASHKPHSSDNAPLDTIESPGVVKRRVEQNQLLPAQSCTDTRLKEKEEEHEMVSDDCCTNILLLKSSRTVITFCQSLYIAMILAPLTRCVEPGLNLD